MKIITTFFILVMLFSLISCDTVTHYTLKVSVERLPTLTIINQTGHLIVVTTPISINMNNGTRTQFQPGDTNRSFNINYTINRIQFTEQVIVNNTDVTVTLTKRPPTVTVVNQTGRKVDINSPSTGTINIGESIYFLPPLLIGNFNITYSSGRMQLTEQVTMNNQDVTVNLTVGAPTLTIVNNTGSGNNINIIQFRSPGSVAWIGGNIAIRDNELYLTEGTAQTGVTTQVLTNGERLSLWLGNLGLSGNAFDIRLQTTNGLILQKDNVRITNDMTLTYTQGDKR